jgi:glycolate oxidase FAD binding subunit
LSWPADSSGGFLGDGRYAHGTDRPETIEALAETVARRVAEGHAIYPQGGRTALDYGGTPAQPGIAIDTRSLNRVIDYPHADMTITVEAGLTLAALQTILAEHCQRLPLDAPHPDRATLGGIFATNTSGPRRFGAGRPRDLILGIRFVTAEGKIVKGGGRVVKNVAGYDFPRLLTGALGTLGIIAEMTLKVRPIPEATALVGIPFATAEGVAQALDRLNTSGTRPIAVELLNRSGARLLGGPLGPLDAEWLLGIGFEDNAAAVAWQLGRLKEEVRPSEIIIPEGADALTLWSALAEFAASDVGAVSFVANVRPSAVVAFIERLDSERWAIQAHAGNGIVRGHTLGAPALEFLAAELDHLRAEAARDGGSVILARCPTAWKESLQVWGPPRNDWALMRKVKDALDPLGVMNPGRFVGTI